MCYISVEIICKKYVKKLLIITLTHVMYIFNATCYAKNTILKIKKLLVHYKKIFKNKDYKCIHLLIYKERKITLILKIFET